MGVEFDRKRGWVKTADAPLPETDWEKLRKLLVAKVLEASIGQMFEPEADGLDREYKQLRNEGMRREMNTPPTPKGPLAEAATTALLNQAGPQAVPGYGELAPQAQAALRTEFGNERLSQPRTAETLTQRAADEGRRMGRSNLPDGVIAGRALKYANDALESEGLFDAGADALKELRKQMVQAAVAAAGRGKPATASYAASTLGLAPLPFEPERGHGELYDPGR